MSEFPIQIEPSALDYLAKMLARKGQPGDFIRVGVKGGGCSGFEYLIKIESVQRESDLELMIGEVKFVCDPKSAKFLSGALLKSSGNLIGGGLTFENPNAERSCGCGTSFTPKS